MAFYRIAGLTVEMDVTGRTAQQAEAYKVDFDGVADMTVRCNAEETLKRNPQLETLDLAEYIATGTVFARKMLDFQGFQLHSSAVELDGKAYLFSAHSGTGKSTHSRLWQSLFGERAQVFNDDKPALFSENGVWYACGTPFSGKTDENLNVKVPVRAIVFIKRAGKNKVVKISSQEAIKLLLEQTLRPTEKRKAEKMLDLVSDLLTNVPVFSLECNMEDEAATESYMGIERILKNEG
jgi:hypothetical protein